MTFNAKKIYLLTVIIGLSVALFSCQKSIYEGYDESLRITDDRVLTDFEYTQLNVVATDDFGRQVVTADSKGNRYVGFFFFLTLGQHTNHSGHYDITKILNYGTNYEIFQQNTLSSPVGAAHFYGEPIWGYYNSEDEWVIRRQIEMLTMASVDYIVFDTTNAVLYQNVVDVVLRVLDEYYQKGWDVPKFMFYLGNNQNYLNDITTLYQKFYKDEIYKHIWFAPEGKPFITKPLSFQFDISDESQKAMSELFFFKTVQWPTEMAYADGLPWIEFAYPQPLHQDWINVSVAQHVTVRFSDTIGTRGRGWDALTGMNDHTKWQQGLNYQGQFDTVMNYGDKAKYVFITGWNEWVAEKMFDGTTYFTVDQFDQEYSRDVEPMRGGYKDNFYLQTIQNIRRINANDAKHYVYEKETIDFQNLNEETWSTAKTYKDFTGEAIRRDYKPMGFGMPNYVNETNRNDIDTIKVVRDDQYMYFNISTVDNITPHVQGDQGWMNLLIKTDNGGDTMYQGYHYVINSNPGLNGKTSIAKASGNNSLETIGEADYVVIGNHIYFRVPLSTLNLSNSNYHIEFKVTDNIGGYLDYLNFYDKGDSAPIGRLNYSYGY